MEGRLNVIEGLRPGLITLSLGDGQWGNGGFDNEIDGNRIPGDGRIASSIHLNAIMSVDAYLEHTSQILPVQVRLSMIHIYGWNGSKRVLRRLRQSEELPNGNDKPLTEYGIMSKPPQTYQDFIRKYRDVGDAYENLGAATTSAGPLDEKSTRLVKLGIAIGMRHEGAVHAHTRKALSAGCTEDEIRHAVLLATTTLGFPSMMAAMTWVEDELEGRR